MARWGHGLFQSEVEMDHVSTINQLVGMDIWTPATASPDIRKEAALALNGVLQATFNMLLDPDKWAELDIPVTTRRDMLLILFGMLVMRLGLPLTSRYLGYMAALVPLIDSLRAQLQVRQALDHYRNDGVPWVLQSMVDKEEAVRAILENRPTFYGGGLGHCADEEPWPNQYYKPCLCCGAQNPTRICRNCHLARYCNVRCQKGDMIDHERVCAKDPAIFIAGASAITPSVEAETPPAVSAVTNVDGAVTAHRDVTPTSPETDFHSSDAESSSPDDVTDEHPALEVQLVASIKTEPSAVTNVDAAETEDRDVTPTNPDTDFDADAESSPSDDAKDGQFPTSIKTESSDSEWV